MKDRDRDKDKDRRRGSSTACLLAALRPPLFPSSSFFLYPTPSSLARIAPLSLDLRCSRLAPTLCSIAIGSRLAPTLCYIALGSSLRCPRFTPPLPSVHASVALGSRLRCPRFAPPLPSVHASVRASGVVVAICFCARRVSSDCLTGFFGFLASGCRATIVPRFGPLCHTPGLCTLLWVFALCSGSL